MARRKAQRRAYGDGSSYQNKKGEWFAAFPLGNGKKTTKRFASKQAADAWREDLKKQRDAVKTQLNATDTQAPELPKRYKPLDPTRGSSSGGE